MATHTAPHPVPPSPNVEGNTARALPSEETSDTPTNEAVGGKMLEAKEKDNAADLPKQAANEPRYHPRLPYRNAGKDKAFLSRLGLNFNLDSFFKFYYPTFRMFGYVGEWGFSKFKSTFSQEPLEYLNKLKSAGDFLQPSKNVKTGLLLFGPREHTLRKKFKELETGEFKAFAEKAAQGFTEEAIARKASRMESAVFTGLALIHAYKDRSSLIKDFHLAVGAELGKSPERVTFADLQKSNNPIVVSAVDRFIWQRRARIGQGLAFIPNVAFGIAANAILITLERTMFYQALAYDQLRKEVSTVHLNHHGMEAMPRVVDALISVIQQEQMDNRRVLLSQEQVEALKPVIGMIAEDIINKQFGLAGVIYIMGGGVLIPDDPEQSRINYEHVREVGVTGVTEEAKAIRQQGKVPSSKVWDTEWQARQKKDYVAESASQEEALERRKGFLRPRPDQHAAPGTNPDPGDPRGGAIIF